MAQQVYWGEDNALEMDRKEGGGFWCAQEGGAWKIDKQNNLYFFLFKKKTKQTKASNLLLA